MVIGTVFAIGIVVLTGMKIMPTEVAAGLAGSAITAIFSKSQLDKANETRLTELKSLDQSWTEWYNTERNKWIEAMEKSSEKHGPPC